MSYIPQLPDNNFFERLSGGTDLARIIKDFGERLKDEPREITNAVGQMELSAQHPARTRASRWGMVDDFVAGAIAGMQISPEVASVKTALENAGEIITSVSELVAVPEGRPPNIISLDEARVRRLDQESARKLVENAYEAA